MRVALRLVRSSAKRRLRRPRRWVRGDLAGGIRAPSHSSRSAIGRAGSRSRSRPPPGRFARHHDGGMLVARAQVFIPVTLPMVMLDHVNAYALTVRDVRKCAEFYRDKIGLKLMELQDEFA